MKKIYSRYGIYNHRDPYRVVYHSCRTGGYNNTGHRVGDTLQDGRLLITSKNRDNDWRGNWTTVYAVKTSTNGQ